MRRQVSMTEQKMILANNECIHGSLLQSVGPQWRTLLERRIDDGATRSQSALPHREA